MKLRQLHGATLLLATLMMITEYNQLSAQFVATFDINPSSNMNQKFLQTKEGDPVNVILNLQQSFSTIGKRFLGVTIDTSLARNGMKTFNFRCVQGLTNVDMWQQLHILNFNKHSNVKYFYCV